MTKFKVGDRVRVIGDKNLCGDFKGLAVGAITKIVRGRDDYWTLDGSINGYFYTDKQIEHAPLTIQAGRYYKTRDGRKVGPMRVEHGGGVWKWNVSDPRYIDGMRSAWRADGGFKYSGNSHPADLIAEWVDEPSVAVNDEPKFKVGDRVVVANNNRGHSDYTGAQGTVINVRDDEISVTLDDDGYLFFGSDELRLVAPATSGKEESDTNLSISFTVDATALDAEIDRVKKRLKKLAKKARKMGIRLDYDLAS